MDQICIVCWLEKKIAGGYKESLCQCKNGYK